MGTATPAAPTPTPRAAAAAPCADESTMELERPGEERKNRRDAMADDSPDSDSADGFLPTATMELESLPAWSPSLLQRAEDDDEHGEVEPAADVVEAADVDASSDAAAGMGSGAADDPVVGRRSREKHPSIVLACLFVCSSASSAFLALLGTEGKATCSCSCTVTRTRGGELALAREWSVE